MEEYEYHMKAMGTDISMSVVTLSQTVADDCFKKASSVIQAWEQRFSRFLPDSELTELNTTKQAVVSKDFWDVLEKAETLFEETKGVFNPLVQVSRLGYNKSFEALADTTNPNLSTEPYDIDFTTVVMNKDTQSVTLGPGQKLDFGGLLKGYLAEKLAKELAESYPAVTGLIINLGGDLYTYGHDATGRSFTFAILNPVTQEDEALTLNDTALVTSGSYKRMWQTEQKEAHHILDATGERSAESDVMSASVIYPDGAAAEAYAKVLLIAGPAKASELLPADIGYLLVTKDGTINRHNV